MSTIKNMQSILVLKSLGALVCCLFIKNTAFPHKAFMI